MLLSLVDDFREITREINDPKKIEFYANNQDFILYQFKILKVKSLVVESNDQFPSEMLHSDKVDYQEVGNQLVNNMQGRWSRKVNKGDREFEMRPDKTKDEIPYDFDSNLQIE